MTHSIPSFLPVRMSGQRVEGAIVRLGQDGVYRPVDPNEVVRAKQMSELKARSPMRSSRAQADADDLPLFVTAAQPSLF